MTASEVRSDTKLITLYQAILSKLPSYLKKMRMNKIEKGVFINGTIVYRIFYGDISAAN